MVDLHIGTKAGTAGKLDNGMSVSFADFDGDRFWMPLSQRHYAELPVSEYRREKIGVKAGVSYSLQLRNLEGDRLLTIEEPPPVTQLIRS